VDVYLKTAGNCTDDENETHIHFSVEGI